ncbi:MAG: Rieske 2Fe-2S domain-containing protein [Thermocladium sp.]|jgi:Ferredoxin subunits of nitrite reductase and ring-hydroxylating dioxygenases|nr:MAG: ferredoxin [Thermocladium sp. ECH_B]
MKIRISTKVFDKENSIITWVNNRPVLVAKVEGRLYAMDAVCAHMGCALLTKVNGYIVTCPAHEAQYDIRTGQLIAKAKIKPDEECETEKVKLPLKTYEASETSDGFIEINTR